MACQYFVNGNWISENQFKELLNNGLLDNLISDNKVDLKGFKTDSSKVLSKKTEEVTRTTIPATKLASILADEIKNRAGYPINMLSALELNIVRKEDGTIDDNATDFKIPLWASPYASKFESLLTSLVSNKIVKQKLPGNSYVLGSEEGFFISEGDNKEYIKNNAIVFTDKFDAEKGLQPLRWDPVNKKMLPAQIMIPFKFRNESGEILKISEFTTKGPDGRMMLDMEKVPEKLLQLFGFRIPTQKQNSMAAVEIVGFLPETSGDLVLAPRDFTKQMGSDFDVDKLYTYMYNHFYKDGKLYTNFVKDAGKIEKLLTIAKQQLEDLKEEYKLSKEDRKLIDKYIKEKQEYNEKNEPIPSELAQKVSALIEESMTTEKGKGYPILDEFKNRIDEAVNTISVLNRSYKASRQNEILDIHLKVMLSKNPEVIAAILALDSSGEFKSLSEDIYKARIAAGKIDPVTTILSETYQRTKFINATAGKNGVGYFSLDSTFNASAQGKDLVMINLTPEMQEELFGTFTDPKTPTAAEILDANLPIAVFGNSVSKGDLSNKYTLRSQAIIDQAKMQGRELSSEEKASLKLKSLVIRSLQSSAVDNEKEQILDKLNINDQTFDAIRAMTILGFEEDEISGLLTQEIVWEFVETIKEARSSLSPFESEIETKIFMDLVKKYDPEGKYDKLDKASIIAFKSKSAEELLNNVFSSTQSLKVPADKLTPDYNLEQLATLEKFLELSTRGKEINQLQSTINSESKGVPKSLIETEAKVKQIRGINKGPIFNAGNLLGLTQNTPAGLVISPKTINGFAAVYGTMFANNVFEKYFPYKKTGFNTLVEEIAAHLPRQITTMRADAEFKQDVFRDIRSYLFANTDTNLFTENPDLERQRLFIDSKTNMSLAHKLSLVQGQAWFQRNGFLNKLDFDLNNNGQISRVNFEAATGENLDERNIYDGFIYLLDKNFKVGTFTVDGKRVEYTSRMLAQELVTAAFLEGGNQGAKQYLKYVPISYLKTLGFGEYLSGVPFDFVDTFFGNVSEYGVVYSQPSAFTRQFFQNNPGRAKTVTLNMLQGNIVAIPEGHFTLKTEFLNSNFVEATDPTTGEPTMEQTKFVSIYDSKLPGKYALFEFDSIDRIYRRIPTLAGSYGFVQYNSDSKNPTPTERVNRTAPSPAPQIPAPGYTIPNIPTKPTQTFTNGVVNNPTPLTGTKSLNISTKLSGTKEAIDDLLNNLADSADISSLNSHLIETLRSLQLPADFKVVYDNTISGRGSFNTATNILTINLAHPSNQSVDDLATVVTHELIHAHTSKSIQQYFRKTYSGRVTSLQPNQIFVFGSNPEGRHGAGAAKYAKDNFGAVYGQGEGLQGQSYALPTKDLRVKTNNSLRSISAEDITENIKKLYEVARQNPTKEFLVSDYSATNLNGYTGQEMADMFNAAGPIPSNIVFNENFNKLVTGLTEKQIQNIQNLEKLQNKYIETLVAQEGSERLNQFTQLYSNWKNAQANFGANSTEASAEYKNLQSFLKEGDLSKYYGAIKLTEFVTMALTDTGFQERLNNIKDEDGVSMWEKIKSAILEILNALGLDVQPGSALAYAIKDSMDLIQANQEELKKNLIETKEFVEFGTKYKFEVDSNDKVTKAEFAQGDFSVFKAMNPANGQKKYDDLKSKPATAVTEVAKKATTGNTASIKPTIDLSREWRGDLESRPVYTPEGVNTMRTSAANPDEHFGNPFSEAGYGNTRKVPTIQTAVQAYKDWLLTGYATWLDENGEAEDFAGNQKQRQWILDQINQGKLDGATLLYAGKSAARGQGMHPTALAEVVEQLRSTQPAGEPTNLPGSETKINIFAGTGENAELSNFAQRPFTDDGIYDVGYAYKNTTGKNITWNTVEAAFQAEKLAYASNKYWVEKITKLSKEGIALIEKLAQAKGVEAKKIGRQIEGLNTQEWDKVSSDAMGTLIYTSFNQNPDALAKLLATGNATLTHTQDEGKWGTEFPKLLMEVRDELRGSQETKFIPKYEIFPGVFANEGQTIALDKMANFLASDQEQFLLKGRGGTGKTTIVKMVMDKSGVSQNAILGTTVSDEARGILASNLPKAIKTRTLASSLGLQPDHNSKTGELFFRERTPEEQRAFDASGKSDPIENAKLIIVDEVSMVGDDLYKILMRKKRKDAKVIFMGDNAQIPPINEVTGKSADSPVFALLENTENFAELSERMRQGEESPILPVTDVFAENIESIQKGEQGKQNPLTRRTTAFDENTNSGVVFTDNRRDIIDGFVADFKNNPDNLKNVVIIGARNETVDNFAKLVREELFNNPTEPFVQGDIIRVNSPFMKGKEVLYANGFKGKVKKVDSLGTHPILGFEVFMLNVEYETMDVAGNMVKTTTTMNTISPENKAAFKSALKTLAVKAKSRQISWQPYWDLKESIVDIGYNYAMTSHKVQGSTYKNVYVLEDDIMSFPGGRLQQNRMMYTAVSRPTTKLVVYSAQNKPTVPGETFNISKLTGLDLSQYTTPTVSTFGEEEGYVPPSEKNNSDYYNDWNAYQQMRNQEEDLLAESPISKDAIEKYLLICGK